MEILIFLNTQVSGLILSWEYYYLNPMHSYFDCTSSTLRICCSVVYLQHAHVGKIIIRGLFLDSLGNLTGPTKHFKMLNSRKNCALLNSKISPFYLISWYLHN